MNVSDILTVVNDHGFADEDSVSVMAYINDTIWDICSREPWPFLEKTIDLTFDGINQVPSNFPSDFRASLSMIDKVTGRIIRPERIDTVEKQMGPDADVVGTPLLYFFQARQMHVAPVPVAGTVLRLKYLALHPQVTSSTLEAGILIPPQHHLAIVLGTLLKLYDQEDDPVLAVRFEQRFEARLMRMRDELWMRQYDRPDYIHVTDVDYYDLDF